MLTTILLAVLLPAVITGVVVLVLGKFGGENGWALGPGIGLALGFAAGQVVLVSWPGLWPVDATYRLFHLALVAAFCGVLMVVLGNKPLLVRILNAVLAALVLAALLRSQIEYSWEGATAVAWLVGLFLAFQVFGLALERLAAAVSPPLESPQGDSVGISLPLLLIILISAGSIATVLGHSAFLGQLAGALAAGIGAVGVLAFFRPATSLAPSALPVVTTVLTGLWMCAYFFASLPAASAVALWLAPWAAILGGLGPLGKRPAWQVLALRVVLILIPAALAVYFAYAAGAAAPTSGYGDYSGY